MSTDRRAILSLIAMGRVTPREAERLLAVWSDRDEVIVRLALCLAIVWLLLPHAHEIFATVSHAMDLLASRSLAAAQQGAMVVSNTLGGRL